MKGITVKLSNGFKFEGESIKSITFHDPKVRDVEEMDNTVGGNLTKVIALSASLSGHPADLIRELNTEDFSKVAAAISKLMGKFQAPNI